GSPTTARVALLAVCPRSVPLPPRSSSFPLPESVEPAAAGVCPLRVARAVPSPYRGLPGRRMSPGRDPPRWRVLPPHTGGLVPARRARLALGENQNVTRKRSGRAMVRALEGWLAVRGGLPRLGCPTVAVLHPVSAYSLPSPLGVDSSPPSAKPQTLPYGSRAIHASR